MSTIVLVHGEFSESAAWRRVLDPLAAAGHRTIAAANPLRGLAADAGTVSDLVGSIDGPVVLVGHAYGGAVITNVDRGDVVGLVYVAAFAPDAGESCFALADGLALADTLEAVLRADETTDLTIAPAHFHLHVAADLSAAEAMRMAATQRPITRAALLEPSGPRPLWRTVPSWFLIAGEDRVIPAASQRAMAERAGARGVVELPGASRAVPVAQPRATAELILEAVRQAGR